MSPLPKGDQWSITLSVPVITKTPLSCICGSGIVSAPSGTVEAIVICWADRR